MPFTFFLDDSDRQRGNEQPGGGIFGMGGVILPAATFCAFERDIEALAVETYGQPIELKWRMDKATATKLQEGKTQGGARARMFEIVAAHGGVSVVTLIYDVRGEQSAVGRDKMRSYAFDACVQRMNLHAQRAADRGPHLVVMDTPPDGPKLLHEVYRDLYRNAYGSTARAAKDNGFASALCVSDATQSFGLQAADFAVGCVVSWAKAELDRHIRPEKLDEKDLRYGRQHMAQWLPVARKGPAGKIPGYGLVCWPREGTFLVAATDEGLNELLKA